MATLYTHRGENIFKTWFLMGVFLALVIAAGYGASWYFNSPLILYIAIGMAFFTNIYSYWFADTLVLKMTNAKPVSREEAPELWNIVENLSITAGLPMPKV